MKRLFYIAAVFMAVAFVLGGCSKKEAAPAQQQGPVTIKVSTVQLPTQQMGGGVKILEANVKKELGDRANYMGYDSAQLYSAAEELEAVARNEVQMVFAIGGVMETISNKIQIVSCPWLFPSVNAAYNVLDNGETGKQIFAPAEQAGMKVMGIFSSGTAAVANNKRPLKVPADFKGLKMRAPGKMDSLNMNALGANAVVTPSEETYSAIQQNVIDGMTTPSSVFVPRRYYEVQKYVTNSDNMSMQMGFLVVSKTWYDGLPADIRASVDRAIKTTIQQIRTDAENAEAVLYATMQQEGCEVHTLTDDEKALWKQAAEPVYEVMEKELGADLMALAKKEADSM